MKRFILFCLSAVIAGNLSAQEVQKGNAQEPEAYRPKVHFSPARGWMSDPNGMVYYDGEYHLCYQHLPEGLEGTHWGHAVSRDLLHWEHLPIAIAPDSLGQIYSGSAVFDRLNTSGLGTAENPPLIAIFTYYDTAAANAKNPITQSQGLAYSTDRGRTWKKYAGNPIIPNPGFADFRDPKMIWDAQNDQWVMVLTGGESVLFYSSKNCIDWSYMSEFGKGRGCHVGPLECPDFFPLKVKGTGQTKWVLLASVVDFTDTPDRLETKTQYFIGDFDGKTFTSPQQDTLWVDYGRDCYAGVTFDNEPHGRRIFVGWMHSHQYAWGAWSALTKNFSGAATFPREMNVVSTDSGFRLESVPAEEIAGLYGETVRFGKTRIGNEFSVSDRLPFAKAPIDMSFSFDAEELPARYGIVLKNDNGEYVRMGYDRDKGVFYVDRTHATGIVFSEPFACVRTAPYTPEGKTMDWRVLVDVASAELFVGGNKIVFSSVFFPSEPFDRIELFSEDGDVVLKKGTAARLHSILPINPAKE